MLHEPTQFASNGCDPVPLYARQVLHHLTQLTVYYKSLALHC